MISSSLFDSTSVPVLEQVVNFTQRRHDILAGNIANLDTPGYRVRDLSPDKFHARLKSAIDEQDSSSSSRSLSGVATSHDNPINEVDEDFQRMLYHDDSNVALEEQVLEISKNQIQHNTAISVMVSQFRLLQAAITERA